MYCLGLECLFESGVSRQHLLLKSVFHGIHITNTIGNLGQLGVLSSMYMVWNTDIIVLMHPDMVCVCFGV